MMPLPADDALPVRAGRSQALDVLQRSMPDREESPFVRRQDRVALLDWNQRSHWSVAMIKTVLSLTLMLGIGLAFPALAQQNDVPPPPPIPEPEPLPPKIQDPDEQIEPQVVIRQEEGQMVEEYSTNGVVYMIRVVPEVGPAYFLIDTTGDGNFDGRFQHDQINPVVPATWKLIEW
jgi:hypothetical protein